MSIGNIIKENTLYYESLGYKYQSWDSFDYTCLEHIRSIKKAGRGDNSTYNDVIIMADIETSKKRQNVVTYIKDKKVIESFDNHVVAFTVSIRAYGLNIVTLYGHRPSELVICLENIHKAMSGRKTLIYFHNLAYDYTFLRKFMFIKWGEPDSQLNVKPHEPIFIRFNNGIEFRDSLILFQRSLEKAGKDFNVEHQKASGKWEYDKLRNQSDEFDSDELEYIEHDTLCGVEIIDALKTALNKKIYAIPYTATGIPREQVKTRGKSNSAKNLFDRICPTYEQYCFLLDVFHGGYTHANRHFIGCVLKGLIECYDFTSSYPFVLLSEKYPMEKFSPLSDCSMDFICDNATEHAFMFTLIAVDVELKDDSIPMPVLQKSKCLKTINAYDDNGRILTASYIEIRLNEMDLQVVREQYKIGRHICTQVQTAHKDYLPRWFTEYIFELFCEKTKLKGVDAVLYALKKGELNSCYGMTVQRYIKQTIEEIYETGEYKLKEWTQDEEKDEYNKHIKKQGTILPYFWGVWCTSYAMYNLFTLGKMATDNYSRERLWIYSDTDSGYFINPNHDAINAYNEICKDKLIKAGFGAYKHNGEDVWLGITCHEGLKDEYSEYVTLGCKRYCGRSRLDNELHITIAGVPKNGVKALNDDISNFCKGTIFPGYITNKKTHTYRYVNDIYIDDKGNETGDSIDLSLCDYKLDDIVTYDWDELLASQREYEIDMFTEEMFDYV